MTRDLHALPDALAHAAEIRSRIDGKNLAIFLDFDGTLAPIVETPDQVVLTPAMHDTVLRLAEHFPVAIISGRDCADVRRHVDIDSIVYAGSHGFDIVWPDGTQTLHDACQAVQPRLSSARAHLEHDLAAIPGVLFEDKMCSFAVHYRLADAEQAPRIEKAVRETVDGDDALRMIPGKKVFEILPAADWDKGRALLWLLREMKLQDAHTVPLFIGDDVTDEDAFRVIAENGIGVLVCDEERAGDRRRTEAQYVLRETAAVQELLRLLGATDSPNA